MKRNRRISFAVMLVIVSLTVTGCGGDFPEFSDSEYNMIVNYAAGLLLRYAKGSNERLTYLDAGYTPEHLADIQPETLIPASADTAEAQTVPPVPPVPADAPVTDTPYEAETDTEDVTDNEVEAETGTDPVTETESAQEPEPAPEDAPPETAAPPQTPDQAEAADPQSATEIPADRVSIESSSLQRIAGGATVEYTGYSVRNTYPDSQTQGAVAAAAGDKLLVVNFTIHNLGGESVRFNTASLNPQFKLLINGDVQGFTMVTMITNDLGGMDTQIAPGGHTEAVLLMEVPESLAKSVDTLDLMVVRGADPQTIRLE